MPIPADVQPGDLITADLVNQILAALRAVPGSAAGGTLPGGLVQIELVSSPTTGLRVMPDFRDDMSGEPVSLEYAIRNQTASPATVPVSAGHHLLRTYQTGQRSGLPADVDRGPLSVFAQASGGQPITSVSVPSGRRVSVFVRPDVTWDQLMSLPSGEFIGTPASGKVVVALTATPQGREPIVDSRTFSLYQ
jgi:hypothetical protein